MIDKEKVIKGLEHCYKRDKACIYCPYHGECCTSRLARDALALLRKQEPVKVVKIQNIQTDTYDWGTETEVRADFYCPDCKKLVASGFSVKFPYCPWCGRKVKWE